MAADRKLGDELAEDVAVLSDDDIRRQNEEQESGGGGGGSDNGAGTGGAAEETGSGLSSDAGGMSAGDTGGYSTQGYSGTASSEDETGSGESSTSNETSNNTDGGSDGGSDARDPDDPTNQGGMTGGVDGPVSTTGDDGSGGIVSSVDTPEGVEVTVVAPTDGIDPIHPEPDFEDAGTICFDGDPSMSNNPSYWFAKGYMDGYNFPLAGADTPDGLNPDLADCYGTGARAGKNAATEARDAARNDGPAAGPERPGRSIREVEEEYQRDWEKYLEHDMPHTDGEEYDTTTPPGTWTWSTQPVE